MDLSDTIVPRSDQINADDLLPGPRTVTIIDVKPGAAEQPVDVILAETPGRAYRPSKSMRRVMVAAWGIESTAWVGKRLTIYCDPEITFGRDKVGGIRISHLSGIAKPLKVALTVTRGKRSTCVVDPLPDALTPAVVVTLADVADCTTDAELQAMWKATTPADVAIREAISQRHTELSAATPDAEDDHA